MEREAAEGTSLERLAFDSAAFAPAQRLVRYREANGQGVEAKEAGPDFVARFTRWRLDRMVLHDRYLNDVMHERGTTRAAADGLDHFMVHFVSSGRYEIDGGTGFQPVGPGGIVLVDMTRPMRSRAIGAHVITVSMARHLVVESAGNVEELHCKTIDRDAAALFTDFTASVARRAPQLCREMIGGVAGALVSLLGAIIATGHIVQPKILADADVARLNRVQRIVDQSLGDPLFGPDAVILQTGLSRATLYRLFRSRGGLRAYIQRRRLDQVRIALSSPGDPRSLGVIAAKAGFLSEGHCSRQFLGAFGIRPGEYRAELADAEAGGRPEPRLDYWIAELR